MFDYSETLQERYRREAVAQAVKAKPVDAAALQAFLRDGIAAQQLRRIVFFGRLETRKGLRVFMEAVMLLNRTFVENNVQVYSDVTPFM